MNRKLPAPTVMITLLGIAALGLAACNGDSEPGDPDPAGAAPPAEGEVLELNGEVVADAELWAQAQDEGGLVVYSAFSEGKELILHEAFTADTGLEVEMVRLPTVELLERLGSERSAGIYEPDIIHMGDEVDMLGLAETDVLEAYQPGFIDEIPSEHVYLDGAYFSRLRSPYGIAYNTGLISEEEAPQSWAELLEPEWNGRVGVADIAAGGTSRNLWQYLRSEVADDYWERTAEQDVTIFGGVGPMIDGLTRGEVEVSQVILGNLTPVLEEGASVDFVVPEEGFAVWPNYIGLVDQAPNPAAGQVYLSWTMSLAGQNVLAGMGEYPVRDGTDAVRVGDRELPPIDSDVVLWTVPRDEYLADSAAWADEWYQTMDYRP